jgi:asparagine synthase (glutamine-hydrolysing)
MAGLSQAPVNTCSIRFSDAAYDESAWAQQVASRYGTRHFTEEVESDDFDLIDELARLYDEPYADSSAIPTYRVCQLARRHVTVALSGDGGDEGFGGYRRYRLHAAEERLRSTMSASLRRPCSDCSAALSEGDWAPRVLRAKSTFQALARDSVGAYFHSVSIFPRRHAQAALQSCVQGELNGYDASETFRRHAQRADVDDPLALVQYLDMKTYLVGDINTKVDRASMAHSLEVREPLMDHPLLEWLGTLPSSFKVRGGEGKALLKDAMKPYPSRRPHASSEAGVRGAARTLVSWSPAGSDATAHPRRATGATGFFDRRYLNQMVEHMRRAQRDYSAPLWTLLMFDAFSPTSCRPSHPDSGSRRLDDDLAHPARPRSLATPAKRLYLSHRGDPARAAQPRLGDVPRHESQAHRAEAGRRSAWTGSTSTARRPHRGSGRGCPCCTNSH